MANQRVISKTLLAGLNTEHVVGFSTYIDDDLSAAKGQVCTREMLPDLGSVRAIVISDPRDIQQSAVCLPTTVHGRRTELLDIQPGAVTYPPYCTGIADKNFELVELKKKLFIKVSFIRLLEKLKKGEKFWFLFTSITRPA